MKKRTIRKLNLLPLITIIVSLVFSHGFSSFASETYTQALFRAEHPVMSSPPYTLAGIERDRKPLLYLYAALPSVIDNSSDYPKPGNQGSQGSCTAWATAYAYKTMQENLDHGWGASSTSTQFSPAFVYNSLNGGRDSGIYIDAALKLMKDKGCCTLADMPYSERDVRTAPNAAQLAKALPHRAESYGSVNGVNDLKYSIFNTGGAVIAIPVYANFDRLSASNPIYDQTTGVMYGWHSICLVGYDDSKQAFKFINSWGASWGLNGFGYISYSLINNTRLGIYGYTMTDYIENTVKNDNSPRGAFESLTSGSLGSLSLTGWAFDDDLPTTAVDIQVYVGGTAGSSGAEYHDLGPANTSRPDIGAAYPSAGNNHGFSKTITTSKSGTQTVYVYATNIDSSGKASGSAALLGSKTVSIAGTTNSFAPTGGLDSLLADDLNNISLIGWAFDDDLPTAAVDISVYIGGTAGSAGAEFIDLGPANTSRPDIGAAYPGRGNNHGFNKTIKTSKTGTQMVYVYATNIDSTGKASGSNVLLGSKSVTLKVGTANNYSPKGSFETLTTDGVSTLSLAGWALDEDLLTAAVEIQVYVGGPAGSAGAESYNLGPANVLRSDIGAAYPGAGNNHGFNKSITTSKSGTQTVYVYAVNIDSSGKTSGSNTLLGSKSVTLKAMTNNNLPRGSVSSLSAGSYSVSLSGWAFDDDLPTSPVNIQVYIGGPKGSTGAEFYDIGPANAYRLDVGLFYPGRGYYHGFSSTVTTTKTGNQAVYVYAVNIDSSGKANGSDVLLDSRTVSIKGAANNYSPRGSLSTLTTNGNNISLTGWAFDDDVPTSPIDIHVYIGGTATSAGAEFHDLGPANVYRSDVALYYASRSGYHGFSKTITTKKTGITTAYVYAVNVDSTGKPGGNNVLLGSSYVIIR